MIFAIPSVCQPLSKCHREIYRCINCQTKLILIRGLWGGEQKSIYTTNQWGEFTANTCGFKIVNSPHMHKRINGMGGCYMCVCVCVCVCVFQSIVAVCHTYLDELLTHIRLLMQCFYSRFHSHQQTCSNDSEGLIYIHIFIRTWQIMNY